MSDLTTELTASSVGRSLADQLCCFHRQEIDGGDSSQSSMVPPLLSVPVLRLRKQRIRMEVVMLLLGKLFALL